MQSIESSTDRLAISRRATFLSAFDFACLRFGCVHRRSSCPYPCEACRTCLLVRIRVLDGQEMPLVLLNKKGEPELPLRMRLGSLFVEEAFDLVVRMV